MSVKIKYPVNVRAIAIILLIAMFHYVAGYRLMYSLGILYSKEQAKECMADRNNIQKIKLSAAEFNSLKWSEANKEFSFDNRMYDIKNVQKLGNNYIITAYSDSFETEIVTALNNFEKQLFHPESSKGAKSAEDIMSSFQKECTSPSEFKITVFAVSGHRLPDFVAQQHPLQASKDIWHPPHIG